MKNAKIISKKNVRSAKHHCVAGMQVRSGVKAGRMTDFQKERLGSLGDGDRGLGKPGDPGGLR